MPNRRSVGTSERSSVHWLSLLKDTGYIDEKSFSNIYQDADEIDERPRVGVRRKGMRELPKYYFLFSKVPESKPDKC